MGQIEAKGGTGIKQAGLAAWTVGKLELGWREMEVLREDLPENTPTCDEVVAIALKGESFSSLPLFGSQGLPELLPRFVSNVEVGQPEVNGISVEWLCVHSRGLMRDHPHPIRKSLSRRKVRCTVLQVFASIKLTALPDGLLTIFLTMP